MFLVCGEVLFDVFLGLPPLDPGAARTMSAAPGGSPFNVAVGLARLGCAVALSTTVSRDSLGRQVETLLKNEGVGTGFLQRSASPTPLALIEIGDDGAPRYGFHGVRDIVVHPTEAALSVLGSSLTGLHIGSIPIAVGPSTEPLLALAGTVGRDRLVSFDPNVRLAVEPDVGLWRERVARFRTRAHLVKVSEEDLFAIHGPDADPESLARGWLGGRTALVVLTRGARGAVLLAGGRRVEVGISPTTLVDTVGAGDSFQAALLKWLQEAGKASPAGLASLREGDLADLGRFASAAAAVTCSRRGADLPRRGDIAA